MQCFEAKKWSTCKYGDVINVSDITKNVYYWNGRRHCAPYDNANTRADRLKENKAAAIQDIWTMLNANLEKIYRPIQCLTVDEQLSPYWGGTRFTQHIPSKPTKYDIKIWWICDSKNAYPLRGLMYTGKSKDRCETNQEEQVVKELAAPYKGSGRNITIDNFFTSLLLSNFFLSESNYYRHTYKK